MRKPLAPFGDGLCPIPSALLSFRNAQGQSRLLPAAWVGVVCTRPAILSVTLRNRPSSPGDLPENGEFAINLPSEEQLASRSFLALFSRAARDLPFGQGLTLVGGKTIGGPVVAECPVRIECRGATFFSRFGQELISGEVGIVHMNGEVYGLQEPVDLCRIKPFDRPFKGACLSGFEGIRPPAFNPTAGGMVSAIIQ